MLKESGFRPVTIFRIGVCLFVLGVGTCVLIESPQLADSQASPVVVSFVNVGQGTAQMVISAGAAVALDVGDTGGSAGWLRDWFTMGSPSVSTLIISHGHTDHAGALAQLSERIAAPCRCIVSPFVDTSELRSRMRAWGPAPVFRICEAGDTFNFGTAGVFTCLWPPRDTSGLSAVPGDKENRLSMVWQFKHGVNQVLFGGDADTVALAVVSQRFGESLASEVFAVPHHGSTTGASLAFWGLVHPQQAVISCGWPNSYGHPSPLVLDIANQMAVPSHITGRDGTLMLRSNGYVWERVSLANGNAQ